MFVSFPGDSSGDEAERSDADFVPEIAPVKSSHKSDDIVTQQARKRKKKPEKTKRERERRKSKRPADN